MPTLEALYRQDPESLPFRQPVDPQLLGIPVSHLWPELFSSRERRGCQNNIRNRVQDGCKSKVRVEGCLVGGVFLAGCCCV